MAVLKKGDKERVANSPYEINTLKLQGWVDTDESPKVESEPAEQEKEPKVAKKDGKKS